MDDFNELSSIGNPLENFPEEMNPSDIQDLSNFPRDSFVDHTPSNNILIQVIIRIKKRHFNHGILLQKIMMILLLMKKMDIAKVLEKQCTYISKIKI